MAEGAASWLRLSAMCRKRAERLNYSLLLGLLFLLNSQCRGMLPAPSDEFTAAPGLGASYTLCVRGGEAEGAGR